MKTLRSPLRNVSRADSWALSGLLPSACLCVLASCGGSGDEASSPEPAAPAGEAAVTTPPGGGGLTIEKKPGDMSDKPLFGASPEPTGTAAVTGAPKGMPNFAGQEGWVEEAPSSGMRFKQFKLPGETPELDALLVVANWPGGIGPIESNLDRWVSQVGSDTPARDLTPEQRWTTEPEGYLITHVHVEGSIKPTDGMAADIAASSQGAILAGFVEPDGSSGVWTVKMTGPAATVKAHKERYLAFMSAL